jgi:hypothetical protein
MTTDIRKMTIDDETLFEDSYRRVEPELQALAVHRLRLVNLEIPSAVAIVLAAIPRLNRYREAIVKEFLSFDVARFDKLEDYARALVHTDTLHSTTFRSKTEQKAIYAEAFEIRDVLHLDLTVLARRKLIDSKALLNYRGRIGYANVAADLQLVAQILKDNWPSLDGKCATNPAEIEHATKLALRLLRVAGQRDQDTEAQAQATDRRNRAFTLFVSAYEDAQRVLRCLRYQEGDASDIAPTLYNGRAGAKKRKKRTPAAASPANDVKASDNNYNERAVGKSETSKQAGAYAGTCVVNRN